MGSIFLHSWWRSSSTYFWQKFRPSPQFIAYYEPLSEGHAIGAPGSREDFLAGSPELWDSNHPPLGSRGYFAEYVPLYRAGTLPVLAANQIYGSFLLDPGDDCPSVERQFRVLAEAAEAAGCRAVFGCVRSLGRIAWLKQRLGGFHLLILRDPIDLWCAMQRQHYMANNDYFVPTSLLIAAKLAARPGLRPLFQPLDFLGIVGGGYQMEIRWMRRIVPLIVPVVAYEAFFTAWLLCVLRNAAAADLVADIGSFALAGERSRIARALEAEAGVALSFDDWQPPAHTGETRRALLSAETRVVRRLGSPDRERLAALAGRGDATLPTLRRLACCEAD